MERSPEVEQLAMAWLAAMKAGDTVAVASSFSSKTRQPRSSAMAPSSGSRVTRISRSGWTTALASSLF